jgi:serine/threonine protein kinase
MDFEHDPEFGTNRSYSCGPNDLDNSLPQPDENSSFRRSEELFFLAMDYPDDEREALVREWCGDNTALLSQVMALIEADSRVEGLILAAPHPASESFLIRQSTAGESTSDDDVWIGRVLGAFRLKRLLGRGGMGVVYLGERIAGGFSQTAAVKLVGRHLRSSPAVAQFLLERETLAKLEHKNIARLLDGGVTNEGFPYVVMEYVEGRRLDEACDDPATTTEQMIQWMLQLCEAVAYVHRNLILHRDLKPGNVMVTQDGVVKLLDFGTLKRIGPQAETDSAMTQAGMRPVTVRYASPEHIQGSALTTASDVYSLGMILYRLIAGRLPEGLEDLPIGQYLGRLQDGRFRRPSGLTDHPIDRRIARDLDAIALKATRYEAEQRYPTANALSEDLWNVIAHYPVSARRGSLRYRAAKFYHRQKWPILAGTAALIVLIAGLSEMAWQGHLARVEEQRAIQGVEEERKLAHMLLFDYFEQLSLIPGSTDAQRRAVTQALTYLDNLTHIASGSDLELDTIRAYTDMGSLLGNPSHRNLGNIPGGIQALGKAHDLAEARVRRQPHDLASLSALTAIDLSLGGIYLGSDDAVNAEHSLQAAADNSEIIAKDPHADARTLQLAADALDTLGDLYDPGRGLATADLSKTMQRYSESDALDMQCLKLEPDNGRCRSDIIVGQYKFGMLVEDSDPALAATHYKEGLSIASQFSEAEKKTSRATRLNNYLVGRLGLMELSIGNLAQGSALVRQSQEGFRQAIARDGLDNRARFDLAAFDTDVSQSYETYGDRQQALAAARELLDIMSVLLQRSPKNTRWQMIQAQGYLIYGSIEAKAGHKASAAAASVRGRELAVKMAEQKDASPEILGIAADGLLALHLHPEDAALALQFAQRAVNAYPRPTPAQLLTLAKAQQTTGQSQSAIKSAKLALASLTGPVKSKIVANQIAEAHAVINAH